MSAELTHASGQDDDGAVHAHVSSAQFYWGIFGALVFLIPFAVALAVLSIPYAARSWGIFEHSREASGLPFVYLLKSLIPLFAVLIGLQGVSQAFRAAMVLIEPAEDQPLSSAVRGRG